MKMLQQPVGLGWMGPEGRGLSKAATTYLKVMIKEAEEVEANSSERPRPQYNGRVTFPRDPAARPGSTPSAEARKGLSGIFFSGFYLALLGAILPAWRHHIEPNYLLIGAYFLSQNLGVIGGTALGDWLNRRRGFSFVMSLASGMAAAALLGLALFSPPMPIWGRLASLALLGVSAGLLNNGVMRAITAAYEFDRAATLNLCGVVFGVGSLAAALFVSGTFFLYSVGGILVLLSVAPIFASIIYARSKMPAAPAVAQADWRTVWRDVKSPAAVLLAFLLFVQFGNEGAVAGWLALFLSLRLGQSPATSLIVLALFWTSLLLGRIVAQWLLPRAPHGRLLLSAVFLPAFASAILSATDNLFGAITGSILMGAGFSIILPLVIERIGDRFPDFHPGFFNGIFTLAVTGGLLAPASLGVYAHYFGVRVVMGLPLAGSILVLILVLLIFLEARLSGRSNRG
jgi:fucose permease